MELTDTQSMVYALYKDDAGQPIMLSVGEDEIFAAIAKKIHPRLHIMCHTRYGKSMCAGLAVLTRATTYPEKWAIVAGTKEKAKIIMAVVNAHIFDNEYTRAKFVPDKGDSLEEIRRYRNKAHLTFKVKEDQYSEVYIGGAQDALGFGAANVVEDEAGLIDDNDHSLVLRMLGDNPKVNFLCKIGNPFARNHFLKSFNDPAYHKIQWDCYKSLEEGVRISPQVIEENRPYSFFRILYECVFPSASEVDESGWMYLVTDEDIQKSQTRKNEATGVRLLGLDVARGGRNYNCWVLRSNSTAEILEKNLDNDLISVGNKTIEYIKQYHLEDKNVAVDDSGVGGGVTDYLKSLNHPIKAVNFGEAAENKTEYANCKAEMFAGQDGLSVWLRTTGMLKEHRDWLQLTEIRYKKDNAGRIKIEPKEDMRKRGVESPDVADALALTFAKSIINRYHGVNPAAILAGGIKPFYKGMPG
jgi:hypothetical protein